LKKPAITFTNQVVEDLRIFLVNDDVDPAQYETLLTSTLRNRGTTVCATIIGASHVINVTHPGGRFSEVVACVNRCKTDGEILYSLPLHETPASYATEWAGLNYTLNRQIGSLDELDARLSKLATKIAKVDTSKEIGLNLPFPTGPDGGRSPRTMIWLGFEGNNLRIETAHEYLPQGMAALTYSTITLLPLYARSSQGRNGHPTHAEFA